MSLPGSGGPGRRGILAATGRRPFCWHGRASYVALSRSRYEQGPCCRRQAQCAGWLVVGWAE